MTSANRPTGTQRSSRDLDQLRAGLEQWLAGRLPPDAAPAVPDLTVPSNGQSSDTVLFEATWHEDGSPRSRRLVARVAPQPSDVPLFPRYDLEREFQVLRLVAEHTDAPVPEVRWLEPDPAPIGAPFFVMSHVDGKVPVDAVYNIDSWLSRATADQQRLLQDSTVAMVARLHAAPDPARHFAFLQYPEAGPTALRRHVAHARAWYDYVAASAGRCPLIEQGFRWVEEHWPADEGDTVLVWGDARIGNVLYQDFRPAALLDWEMAGLGPREIDIAWLVSSHEVFEQMARRYGAPGMPDFMRLDDVTAEYAAVTGHAVRNMDFYLTYAHVQWATVLVISLYRLAHFGHMPMPDDIQDLILNRRPLERLLASGA